MALRNWIRIFKIKIMITIKILSATALLLVASLSTAQQKNNAAQLPQKAKDFVSQHFAKTTIQSTSSEIEHNRTEFEVKLANGVEIEFDDKGNWHSVDGNNNDIPTDFIDSKIVSYVKTNFPNDAITQVDIDPNDIEVELKSDTELKFDRKGNFIRRK